MRIADVMTTNVISIPSNISLAEAKRIMDANHFSRLPVIDKGKLVGIVTKNRLDKMGPSKLTTFSIHEMGYLVNTIQVKEVMKRDVITVTPDTFSDDAVGIAQKDKAGMLVVVDDGRVVGVVTSTDFFYKVLNPVLGINLPGTRIYVQKCKQSSDIKKVMAVIENCNIAITSLFMINVPDINETDLAIQLAADDCSKCIEEIRKLGYSVIVKPH